MSQLVSYTNYTSVPDGATVRRYTGYPLNSTLVSSYTPETIRSIINHAASGQPYNTVVWIQVTRVGIQISAQDAQIARSRKPVFIPINLVHDIFMQPNIGNVICIIYDELQSRMKGVLLYVVHPNDAQSIREDFRQVKQGAFDQTVAIPTNYSSPFDNRYSTAVEMLQTNEGAIRSTQRQLSPRRPIYVREEDSTRNGSFTPNIRYTPSKNSYQSSKEDEGGHRRRKSPRKARRSSKERRKHRSRSPEKQPKMDAPKTSASQDFQKRQEQQQHEQQQQTAWEATQQMPLIPMGIYNRYVPKTIPLPTGETLKTSLPPPVVNGQSTNGLGVAYIEPLVSNESAEATAGLPPPTAAPSSSSRRSHHSSKHQSSSIPRTTQRTTSPPREITETDELKRYLKVLVDEMRTLKLEMNKIQQTTITPTTKGRSDSIQVDLKQLKTDIDALRSRMAATPKLPAR